MWGVEMNGALLQGAELLELSPDDIEIGTRIGFLHEEVAIAHGRTMAAFGQRDPIKVRPNPKGARPWLLVTGRHRLEGARLEGIPVWAIVVEGKPEDFVDLEASENLHRRSFKPIERAMFVHSLITAAQERLARQHGNLSQHKLGAKIRWEKVKEGKITRDKAVAEQTDDACDSMSRASGWVASAAEALDLGRREIDRSIRLHRFIIEPFPDLAEPLSKHPVVGANKKQLLDITKIDDAAVRRAVIERLIADPEIGVEEAELAVGISQTAGPTPVAYQKHLNAIQGGWSRLSLDLRNRFVREKLPSMLTPSQKRELRDLLIAELDDD